MNEEKLIEFSENFNTKKKKFFILTHKKHKREIYFRNTPEAIDFLRKKMGEHELIYFLIKKNIIRPFLKQVSLSGMMGDVIFIGNEIKCFDLKNKVVVSFPLNNTKKEFIKNKTFQKKIGKEGFAPEILKINKTIPYSKEELLEEYKDDLSIPVSKLLSFYKKYKTIHGDIVGNGNWIIREHILKKGNSCVFIDWELERTPLIYFK